MWHLVWPDTLFLWAFRLTLSPLPALARLVLSLLPRPLPVNGGARYLLRDHLYLLPLALALLLPSSRPRWHWLLGRWAPEWHPDDAPAIAQLIALVLPYSHAKGRALPLHRHARTAVLAADYASTVLAAVAVLTAESFLAPRDAPLAWAAWLFCSSSIGASYGDVVPDTHPQRARLLLLLAADKLAQARLWTQLTPKI